MEEDDNAKSGAVKRAGLHYTPFSKPTHAFSRVPAL